MAISISDAHPTAVRRSERIVSGLSVLILSVGAHGLSFCAAWVCVAALGNLLPNRYPFL
jgi:hypothetical protein